MGDLNCNLITPQLEPGKSLLMSLALASANIQKISPTRIGKHSETCIDIIAISNSLICTEYKVGSFAASDHLTVEAKVEISVDHRLKPIMKRSFNKVDYHQLGLKMEKIELRNSYNNPSSLALKYPSNHSSSNTCPEQNANQME